MNRKTRIRSGTIGSLIFVGLLAGVVVFFTAAGSAAPWPWTSRPWSFGVMSDTQWTCKTDPAGQNPNGVSVSIINQLNQQFIQKHVKFVIQVGDLTENGYDADIAVRAQAAQTLYTAGIGFFPMRGNHETYATNTDGTPANGYGIAAVQANFPQTRGLTNTFGAANFSSPTDVSPYLDGMSYSFDYNNARFVIIDDWATPNKRVDAAGYPYGYSIADQQDWIWGRLKKTFRRPEHAFVFSHQNLIGENHQDCLFDGYTNDNPDMQNAFFASLQKNGVGCYICGHDHIHQRSLIASPDGKSKVQEIICASDSSKFYTPKALTDPKWYGQKVRETSVSQERYAVGFYIYTVDGPRVTVDYYSDDHGNWLSDANYPNGSNLSDTNVTPTFNFVKKETWSYSLNGQEFTVGQGRDYTVVKDRFLHTSAQILAGTNTSTAQDYTLRPLTQIVDTGWTSKIDYNVRREILSLVGWKAKDDDFLRSDVLSLTGMAKDIGKFETPVYVLSMSYEQGRSWQLGAGGFGLATLDDEGNWVKAVSMNTGGTVGFVNGPWNSGYGLGTYGVDPSTKTAWAVINFNGDFAVANGIDRQPSHTK
ncbi:MAG TPA: metallophosphoesterase [Terriglobales bacterium]|nr:metallophosphoesterase [Terriglobales bacterium]